MNFWSTDPGPQVYAWTLRDMAHAPSLALDVTHAVTNAPANDDRFARIRLTAGQSVYFAALEERGYNWGASWQVLDPFHRVARRDNCSELNSGFNNLGIYTAPVTVDYLVGLGSYVGETAAEASRSFRVSTLVHRTESLTVGTVVSGGIEMPGELRNHTFSLERPARIHLDLLSRDNVQWRLSGPSGDIDSASFPADGWRIYDLAQGDYRLSLSARNTEAWPYRFRILDLANATPIELGTTVTHSAVLPITSSQVSSIRLLAGQRLFPRAISQSECDSYGADWTMRSPGGSTVFDSSFSDRGVGLPRKLGGSD